MSHTFHFRLRFTRRYTVRLRYDLRDARRIAISTVSCYLMQVMKECRLCGKVKSADEFPRRKSAKDGRRRECKECTYTRHNKRCDTNRLTLIYEHGGCCSVCGYDKCVAALHFHHRLPGSKIFSLHSCRCYTIETAREEAKKTVLLCSNCHIELHNP